MVPTKHVCFTSPPGEVGEGGDALSYTRTQGSAHTPSTAFRHLPPKAGCRKPVLGVWAPRLSRRGVKVGWCKRGLRLHCTGVPASDETDETRSKGN